MGVVKLSTAGILDYQKYSSALAGNSPYIPFTSSFELLETEILTGSQSSVTFSSLNSTYGADYQHLQVRFMTRTDRSGQTTDPLEIQFNSDTGSNYQSHLLYGDGGSVVSGSTTGGGPFDAILSCYVGGASSTANSFTAGVIDILDAFETTKYTTTRTLAGMTSLTLIQLFSGGWRNTAAVDSIKLMPGIGTNLVQYSRFSLYGLKASA